jgi:hypothetical protein
LTHESNHVNDIRTKFESFLSLGDFEIKQNDFAKTTDYSDVNAYPMPSINWGFNRQRTPAGDLLSDEYSVSLDGIITIRGDDSISKLMERTANFQDKIITNNGKPFYYVFNNHMIVSGYAQVKNLSFNENQNYWRDYVSYTMDLAIPISGDVSTGGANLGGGSNLIDVGSPTNHITSCEDTYSIQQNDDTYSAGPLDYDHYPTYTLTRSISATSKAYANNISGALSFAQEWVQRRTEKHPITSLFPATQYGDPEKFCFYNQDRKMDFSEAEGKYGISDTFLLKYGQEPWLYTNTINTSVENTNLRKVTVNGEIIGLEPAATGIDMYMSKIGGGQENFASGIANISGMIVPYDYTLTEDPNIDGRPFHRTLKYENAVSGYQNLIGENAFYRSAIQYDSTNKNNAITSNTRPLHGNPSENTESFFFNEGKVAFSRTYDSRPTGMIQGSVFENFTLTDSKPATLLAPISILGRRLGPIYYNTQGFSNVHTSQYASGVGSRSITFEAFFPRPTGMANYKFPQEDIDKIDTYMLLYKPSNRFTGYKTEDSQTLDLTSNKLTKTITWEYVICSP